jgi:hypothetical protein
MEVEDVRILACIAAQDFRAWTSLVQVKVVSRDCAVVQLITPCEARKYCL